MNQLSATNYHHHKSETIISHHQPASPLSTICQAIINHHQFVSLSSLICQIITNYHQPLIEKKCQPSFIITNLATCHQPLKSCQTIMNRHLFVSLPSCITNNLSPYPQSSAQPPVVNWMGPLAKTWASNAFTLPWGAWQDAVGGVARCLSGRGKRGYRCDY